MVMIDSKELWHISTLYVTLVWITYKLQTKIDSDIGKNCIREMVRPMFITPCPECNKIWIFKTNAHTKIMLPYNKVVSDS